MKKIGRNVKVNTSIKTFYFYMVTIFVVLFLLEIALEYRHYNMGFETTILGKKEKILDINIEGAYTVDSVTKYGPTETFPFKSVVLDTKKNGAMRIWVASASHAEGGRVQADAVFPNLICANLKIMSECQVINGSRGGMTIKNNVAQLNEYASHYQPDYAILYQMYMSITGQEKLLIHDTSSDEISSSRLFDFSQLKSVLQSLSLYGHLIDYIGGNIKLAGQLNDSLPLFSEKDFEIKINSFIDACRERGIKPILATFAASHDLKNLHEMRYSLRTDFVKYIAYLSPKGRIKTITKYNNILRKIAKIKNVPLIDIGKKLNGDPQYFIDFVHFNEKGHSMVASIIALKLERIFISEGLSSDL